MKKLLTLMLALLLTVCVGCKKAEEVVASEEPEMSEAVAAPTAAPEAKPEAFEEPDESMPLIQLENIDYDSEKEQIILILSRQTFIPAPADENPEQDFQIIEASPSGETESLLLAKDAVIEFPLPDPSMGTVSILPEEMTEEYESYLAANPGARLLFSITEDGDGEVSSLIHFYTP